MARRKGYRAGSVLPAIRRASDPMFRRFENSAGGALKKQDLFRHAMNARCGRTVGARPGGLLMSKGELIIQLVKVALGLLIGGYFLWWSLEVLKRLPPPH